MLRPRPSPVAPVRPCRERWLSPPWRSASVVVAQPSKICPIALPSNRATRMHHKSSEQRELALCLKQAGEKRVLMTTPQLDPARFHQLAAEYRGLAKTRATQKEKAE